MDNVQNCDSYINDLSLKIIAREVNVELRYFKCVTCLPNIYLSRDIKSFSELYGQ
jgi:hypothetical protein